MKTLVRRFPALFDFGYRSDGALLLVAARELQRGSGNVQRIMPLGHQRVDDGSFAVDAAALQPERDLLGELFIAPFHKVFDAR